MLTGNVEVDAMVEDVLGRAELALLRTINLAAGKVFEEAQIHVPKSGEHQPRPGDPSYPEKPLEESGRIEEATPGNPRAEVIYDSPYAKPQEVGEMVYHRGEKEVHWVAEHYTTPGTGAHFLGDALKLVAGQLEVETAVQSRIAFGEVAGPVSSRSSIRAAARQEEILPAPTGQLSQTMRQSQTKVDNAAVSSFITPPTLQ